MAKAVAPEPGSLEERAVAAHRAYLDALVAWERTLHRMNCALCGPSDLSENERAEACDAAEAEKEAHRIAFRDLCDKLGFVPTGHDVALPAEDPSCCKELRFTALTWRR
ncbi:hypothetical protein ACFSKM_01525 [Ancylobacter dichloromethanicus]